MLSNTLCLHTPSSLLAHPLVRCFLFLLLIFSLILSNCVIFSCLRSPCRCIHRRRYLCMSVYVTVHAVYSLLDEYENLCFFINIV
jgi:hypothetical protein